MYQRERIFDDPRHQAEYEKIVDDVIAADRNNQSRFRKSVDEARAELEGRSTTTVYTERSNDGGNSNNETNPTAFLFLILFFFSVYIGIVNKSNKASK
jgi:hypothetical protein